MINNYRNRSGVSWDGTRGGFWSETPNELAQFREHLGSLQARVSHRFTSPYAILLLFSLEKGYAEGY